MPFLASSLFFSSETSNSLSAMTGHICLCMWCVQPVADLMFSEYRKAVWRGIV